MQVLQASGLPIIGTAFSKRWRESIGSANPKGFFESEFRRGIYYATNPHRRTGKYLAPKATREHVVKVFAPGLARSDVAFLHRVIFTVRPWREYVASIGRLYALEDDYLLHRAPNAGQSLVEKARRQRSRFPPEVEWWYDNYVGIRDIATRRYSSHVVAFGALLDDPVPTLSEAFSFIGTGDLMKALHVVAPALRTQRGGVFESEVLEPSEVDVFDELYRIVLEREPLTQRFVDEMNRVHVGLKARVRPAPATKAAAPARPLT